MTEMPVEEIYLVRHAIAAARGEEWPDDSKRPLTERGVERFKECVDGLVWLDVGIDEVFTSPFVRARQTAEYLSAGLPSKPPIKVLDALAPGHSPAEVVEDLARESRKRRVALVGHEPDLGELAAYLLGTRRAIPFKKGAVCRIDVDGLTSSPPGTLSWFLSPKVLRKLGQ